MKPIKLFYRNRFLRYAALFLAAFSFLYGQNKLKFGSDIFLAEQLDLLSNKSVGVVTNKAAVLSSGRSLIDELRKLDQIDVRAYFALEHGLELESSAGMIVEDSQVDETKVYSLYGSTKKPTREMLQNIDVIIFDVQDVGARFYTYISSLYYIIEACSENNVELIVLDRPNPIGGTYVDGPVLDDDYKSFVGIDNLPVTHGMTVGELALFFNDRTPRRADLQVIRMQGWKRDSFWDDYDLRWVNPSPNIMAYEACLLYPATVFFEGTNISEGRGTYTPFQIFGAPFLDSNQLRNKLNKLNFTGIDSRAIEFVPMSIFGKAENPKYKNSICEGVQLKIVDRDNYKPVELAVYLLHTVYHLYKEEIEFTNHFDLLWGTDQIRQDLLSDKSPEQIIAGWQDELNEFKKLRENYLLY